MNQPVTSTALALQLPTDARELRSLAEFISTSRLIPANFQKSPADCWMVLDFCREKRLNFFATVGHCSIIKNNLMFDGQLSATLLNISGFLAERLSYTYERDNAGVAKAVTVSARLINETTPRTATIELAKAKTQNAVWQSQPEQQLAYAGARVWGRRHLPEVLLGVRTEGETIDITPNDEVVDEDGVVTTPTYAAKGPLETMATTPPLNAPGMPNALAMAAHKYQEEQERERAEIIKPHPIPRDGNDELSWRDWVGKLMSAVYTAPSADAINEWTSANFDHLAELQKASVKLSAHTIKMISDEIEKRK